MTHIHARSRSGTQRFSGILSGTAIASAFRVKDMLSERANILARCKGEFIEMPCMRVTVNQATRLWSLDSATCEWALEALVRTRFLRKSGAMYSRNHSN